MASLDRFLKFADLYKRPTLRIRNSLKLCLERIVGDYLELLSRCSEESMTRNTIRGSESELLDQVPRKVQKSLERLSRNYRRIATSNNPMKEIRKLFASSEPDLFKKLTENVQMEDFFNSRYEYFEQDYNSFTTCHPGYIFFFKIAYLHSLNKLLEDELENIVGSNWRNNNIWYGVCIDKNLLDTVFGSIKKLEKLFFASGILQKGDNLRRAKFCTRGEEILPAIQQKLVDLEFKIKSYFVVAQVFSKHIQLTLHQVVILKSSEEDAASIIIQDEIIYVDDVYDDLCKILWTTIRSNRRFKHCRQHQDKHNAQYDAYTYNTCVDIFRNLKPCVVRLLEMNKTSMDMNSKIHLNINGYCFCSISIFLRDIIEVALMSVIENMATIIAASLTNKNLFGNYVANHIFVIGDPFNLSHGSKIHTTYSMLLQKAIDDAVCFKEKDTMTFVLGESLCQLLELVTHTKPYMYGNFINGTLCQVSSETYTLRVKEFNTFSYFPFFRIDRYGDIKNILKGDGSYFVFIQKGKPVSTKAFLIQQQEYFINPEFNSSKHAVPNQYDMLDELVAGTEYRICTELDHNEVTGMVVECKQISHNLSIKVSRGCMGHDYNNRDFPFYRSLNIIEPLTLAYI